jgi:uncharacterized membrane protein
MSAHILELIEVVAVWIDAAGVVVIVVGIAWGLAGWLRERVKPGADGCAVYMNCRQRVGRSIVLGLEILVASDIIHTVAIEPTMMNAGVLAVLIVIRTFISWTLVLDLENRWPWQKEKAE